MLNIKLFHLLDKSTDICTSKTNTGEYSCLVVKLELKRDFSYYLIMAYIPCTMMTIMAYLSFWIDHKKTTARVLITVVTLLIAATNISVLNLLSLPATSYTKSIDVWTGVSLTFIMSALVEFVVVHFMAKRACGVSDSDSESAKKEPLVAACPRNDDKPNCANCIDSIARISYPIAWVAFVLLYLAVYYRG